MVWAVSFIHTDPVEQSIVRSICHVCLQVDGALSFAGILADSALADLERLQALENTSEDALDKAIALQTMTPRIIDRLDFYNKSAYDVCSWLNMF